MIRAKFYGYFSCMFCLFHLSFSYIQLSSLKSKMFHKILVNKKIKTDFKKITSNDAYQLACFWYDELAQANTEDQFKSQGINLLYRPTKHVFENSINLTDFKYNIISDIDHDCQYYIWRPKIQICLPSLYSVNIDDQDDKFDNGDNSDNGDNDDTDNNRFQKTLLYPSFRETMYLLSLDMNNRSKPITINNIVESPYWNEPKHDSYEILQCSIERFFVDYLKYSGLKYK